jgi:hypothetical protein
VSVYALSFHADYRCRHSGRCCTADWDVPVEIPVYRSLSEAVASGRLRPAAPGVAPFVTGPDLPGDAGAMLERTVSGDCVFFERGSGLCVVHRDLGEAALPVTCRHFPRLAVRDRRGTFITLSHFCPTAASMLFREDVRVEIVAAPGAFPPGDYDGLEAAPDDWPPLLTPRTLMDLDGYSAWERHMVARCAEPARLPESVVATLARDARLLGSWKPGALSLADSVERLPREPVEASAAPDLAASLAMWEEVGRAVPQDLRPAPDEGGLDQAYARYARRVWSDFAAPLNRFLAAKAFASWTAYQGRGVATIVRGLEAALGVVRVEAARECRNAGRALDADLLLEAFRGADFLLNHLAVGEDLARLWSRVESR